MARLILPLVSLAGALALTAGAQAQTYSGQIHSATVRTGKCLAVQGGDPLHPFMSQTPLFRGYGVTPPSAR